MTTVSEQDDKSLVSLSKDGDLAAFNTLVDRHERDIYNLCYRLLGERQSAEDATQETFLSAYRALSRFAGGNVRSWLLRIAANQSKDELRRRKRKDRAASLDQMFDTIGSPVEIPDHSPSSEQSFENKERAELLQLVLLELPIDQRRAVVLVDLLDHRYEEAATVLEVSVGTIKSRIHRGRSKFAPGARPETGTSCRLRASRGIGREQW